VAERVVPVRGDRGANSLRSCQRHHESVFALTPTAAAKDLAVMPLA
jgi:hypothetical protein